MHIVLKNGRWITDEGKKYNDLNQVEKMLFDVLIGFQKIITKYNL